jgi:hypothetical protein
MKPLRDYPPVTTTRWRFRWLTHSRGRFTYRVDRFPQGRVYRVWLGLAILTVMVPSPEQRRVGTLPVSER